MVTAGGGSDHCWGWQCALLGGRPWSLLGVAVTIAGGGSVHCWGGGRGHCWGWQCALLGVAVVTAGGAFEHLLGCVLSPAVRLEL